MIKIGESGKWAVGMIPTGNRAGVYFYGSDVGIRRMRKELLFQSYMTLRQQPMLTKADLVYKFTHNMKHVKEKKSPAYTAAVVMDKWNKICNELGNENIGRLYRWGPSYRSHLLYGLWHYGDGFPSFVDEYPVAAYMVTAHSNNHRTDKLKRIFDKEDRKKTFQRLVDIGIFKIWMHNPGVESLMIVGQMLPPKEAYNFFHVSDIAPEHLEGGPISKSTGQWARNYSYVLRRYYNQPFASDSETAGINLVKEGFIAPMYYSALAFCIEVFGKNILDLGPEAFVMGNKLDGHSTISASPMLPEFSGVGKMHGTVKDEDGDEYTICPIATLDDAFEAGFHIWPNASDNKYLRLAYEGEIDMYMIRRNNEWAYWFATNPGDGTIVGTANNHLYKLDIEELLQRGLGYGGRQLEFGLPTRWS